MREIDVGAALDDMERTLRAGVELEGGSCRATRSRAYGIRERI